MAANKRKILEAARKHAQKGAKDKALKEYQRLLKADPRDAKLRLEVGDAYRRWGQVDAAIAAYAKVAEHYMSEGFDARAVAVYKQIHNLEPERYDTYEPLAELYQRMGLTAEAIGALQTAADGYHRAGQRREALELLRKMSAIDPTNTTSRIKVADLLRQEQLSEEAIAEYEEVASELERQGSHEQLDAVLARILEIDPERVETLARLARSLMSRGLGERAEPFAKRALELGPENVENYELLGDVYRATGKEDGAQQVYSRLAQLYDRRGDAEAARDIRQRLTAPQVLDVSGGDAELQNDEDMSSYIESSMLVGDDESGFLEESRLSEPETLGDDDVIHDVSDLLEDEEIDLSEESAASESAPPVDAIPKSAAREKGIPRAADFDPEQLLAEASVYLRYGKRKQAIENLESILGRDPRHRAALEKLGEAFADGGENERAKQAWARAVELAREDGDDHAVAVLEGRVGALGGGGDDDLDLGDESLDLSDELDPAGMTASGPPLDTGGDFEDTDIELDLGDTGLDVLDEDGSLDAGDLGDTGIDSLGDLELEGSEPDDAADAGPGEVDVDEALEEAAFYIEQGLLDEAEAVYRRVLESSANHPVATAQLAEIESRRASGGERDVPEIEVEAPVAEGSDPTAGIDLDGESADSIEIEFDEGLGEESDPEPEPVAAVAPPKPKPAPAPKPAPKQAPSRPAPAAAAAPDVHADSTFDLAAALSDVFDAEGDTRAAPATQDEDGFAAVFSEFKKGVSAQLNEGDQQAHYDLGIAYREMGLLDDAAGEFRAAMQSGDLRSDSLHMLGLCAIDRGEPQEAIGHLEEALGLPGATQEQQLAARFELGRAHQALGDADAARTAWELVAAVDESFCDVGVQLAQLGGGAPPPAAKDGEFESFDDLLAEANAEPGTRPQDRPTTEIPLEDTEPDSEPPAGRKKSRKKISFM